jgi:hypothetical protein
MLAENPVARRMALARIADIPSDIRSGLRDAGGGFDIKPSGLGI